jgi:hypothetical protein
MFFDTLKIHVLTVIQEFEIQKLCVDTHPALPRILFQEAVRETVAS